MVLLELVRLPSQEGEEEVAMAFRPVIVKTLQRRSSAGFGFGDYCGSVVSLMCEFESFKSVQGKSVKSVRPTPHPPPHFSLASCGLFTGWRREINQKGFRKNFPSSQRGRRKSHASYFKRRDSAGCCRGLTATRKKIG